MNLLSFGRRRVLSRRYGRAASKRGQGIKIDKLRIAVMVDQNPDLSYLTGGGDPEYAEQDRERYEAYGNTWHMVGVRAEAELIVPTGGGHGIMQHVTSGGLWGIESDSGKKYLQEVAKEEYRQLVEILRQMGVRRAPAFASAEWVDR